MLEKRTRVLVSEVAQQSRFAMMAYHDATTALAAHEMDRLWYSLQSLLTAAARLAELLWPGPDNEAARQLRETLGIGEIRFLHALASPQSQSTEIQHWIEAGPPRAFIPSKVGGNSARSSDPRECARLLDPEDSRVTLYGSEYQLQPLLAGIAEIGERANAHLKRLDALM